MATSTSQTADTVSSATASVSHPTFSLDSPADAIRSAYDEHGYVVFSAALPPEPIEAFLAAYRAIRTSRTFVYYSQSFQRCMRPEVNEHGFIVESMQNASRLALHPRFAKTFQRCIYHPNVAKLLTLVSGSTEHVSWQNMFFDRSTGTVEHQDSWYLDTEPAGSLMGTWFALEDITADAGPFFVSPGSHRLGLLDRSAHPDHKQFVAATRKLIADHKLAFEPCLLKRGDVLVWHPFLIHGAFDQTDARYSRKSFTSHFYPRGARAKDTESGKLLSIYDHQHPRPTDTHGLYTAYRFPDAAYNALVYAKYAVDAVRRGRRYLDMGRRAYG